MARIQVKRVYAEASPQDGARVLVDRIWPRGLTKEAASLTAWIKDVAPSTALRKWYNHDPARFADFKDRYRQELAEPARQQALRQLHWLAAAGPVTLLTASKDIAHSNAAVLAEMLSEPTSGANFGEAGPNPR
jgi:uncharacterized protein YeaO (DUF488 family)